MARRFMENGQSRHETSFLFQRYAHQGSDFGPPESGKIFSSGRFSLDVMDDVGAVLLHGPPSLIAELAHGVFPFDTWCPVSNVLSQDQEVICSCFGLGIYTSVHSQVL